MRYGRSSFAVLALLCVCAAGLLAACGSDGEEETTAPQGFVTEPPDPQPAVESNFKANARGGYRARLDEICLAADRAITFAALEELAGPGDPDPTRAELQRFYDEVVIPTRKGQLETMQKVEAPPSGGAADTAAVQAYLEAFRHGVIELGADLALIKNPGIEDEALAPAQELAAAAGLRRCAGEAGDAADEG